MRIKNTVQIAIVLLCMSHKILSQITIPVATVSSNNISLIGLPIINGVRLGSSSLILLTNQVDSRQNGVWAVQQASWTRPASFASGNMAGNTVCTVTIQKDGVLVPTPWVCTTPNAIIDHDPITFIVYNPQPGTTATNIGIGSGDIFAAQIGSVLQLRSLKADTHTIITTTQSEVIIGSDATANNIANTIVARDSTGSFTANFITGTLVGSATQNVLKAGDTMTGRLLLPAGTTAIPSLSFSTNSNSGLSSPSSNAISISTNGSSRITVDTNTIQLLLPLIRTQPQCDQATMAATPSSNNTITTSATTSILILRNTANVNNVTVVFPPNPINGQLFTILLGTTNTASLNNAGGTGGATIVNPITSLNPTGNPGGSTNGTSVTYYYYNITNSWYRMLRG